MLIQCTKKVLDQLKLKPEPGLEENPLYSWHANLITIYEKEKIVFMNDQTRYIIVIDSKANGLSQIKKEFTQAVRNVLLHEGIKEEIVERYIQDAGDILFTKTKDRSHVARLNMATRNTEMLGHRRDMIDRMHEELSMKISRYLVTDGNNDYIHPNEVLYEELRAIYGEQIFSTKAAEVKVTLMLDKYEVYRQLIVPLNRTFTQFHHILQTAFNWMDYHLYEFYILGETKTEMVQNHSPYTIEGYQPVLHLVSDEESFSYPTGIEMKWEYGRKLSEFIPGYKQLIYHYDFGDSWRHKIEVLQVIDNYNLHHPVCTDGVGDAPPEDVGGENGFQDFLRIINNPNDPEFKHIQKWVIHQGYAPFDQEMINQRLKNR